MDKNSKPCRRDFLKTSAVGAAGALVTVASSREAVAQQASSWPATGYIQINPNIDNCRVAYITDATMIKRIGWTSFSDVNTNAIDFAKVQANMDKMAICLARKATAAEAWATIFRKPTAKTWATVKVAMKVNTCGGGVGPNAGAVGKFCKELIALGVTPANITIYDAGAASGNGSPSYYTPFRTSGVIPAGVTIEARGTTCPITVDTHVGPWTTTTVATVRDADILVNIAVAKGHDRLNQFSGVTMTIKNHVGTVNFAHRDDAQTVGDLAAYHKHPYLLGTPSADVPAKQQLCFVDSLWGGKPGSWAGAVEAGSELNTLTMGTLAGPVDYYTTKKIRTKKYNDFNVGIVNSFITAFGYSAAEQAALDALGTPDNDPKGRGFINADSAPVVVPNDAGAGGAPGAGGATGTGGAPGAGGATTGAGGAPGAGGATGSVGGATGSVGGATGSVGGATGSVGGATGSVGGATGVAGGAAGAAAEAAADAAANGCACGVAPGAPIGAVPVVAAAIGGLIVGLGRRVEKVEREKADRTASKAKDRKPSKKDQ